MSPWCITHRHRHRHRHRNRHRQRRLLSTLLSCHLGTPHINTKSKYTQTYTPTQTHTHIWAPPHPEFSSKNRVEPAQLDVETVRKQCKSPWATPRTTQKHRIRAQIELSQQAQRAGSNRKNRKKNEFEAINPNGTQLKSNGRQLEASGALRLRGGRAVAQTPTDHNRQWLLGSVQGPAMVC